MKRILETVSSSKAGTRILGRMFSILRRNPRLTFFPLISTVVGTSFFLFFASTFAGATPNANMPWVVRFGAFLDVKESPSHLGPIAAYYLLTMFVGAFFNVAFYHEAMRAYAGEQASINRGVSFAMRRVIPILTWSLFAGSIGLGLRLLADKLGWLGKITTAAAGFAWSVAAVFALPVLVREGNSNPVYVLKRSAGLVNKTWGGLVVGVGALWAIPMLIPLVMIFLVIPAVAIPAVVGRSGWFAMDAVMIAFIGVMIAYSVFVGLLKSLYYCGLYIYVTEGVGPDPLMPEDMDAGWKIKGV